MAINWNSTYPNTESATSDYPFGSAKNETTPGALDGTPLERAGFNDVIGVFAAVLSSVGAVPSGNPETANASQVLDALINHRWYDKTNYVTGTRVVGSDGLPYRAVQDNGPTSGNVIDPVTETAPRAYWLPEEQYFNDKAHPVGSIYSSMDSTDPSEVLGIGSWVKIEDKFLVSVGTDTDWNAAGKTGGAKTHNHTSENAGSHDHGGTEGHSLTTLEMPEHSHEQKGSEDGGSTFGYVMDNNNTSLPVDTNIFTNTAGSGDPHTHGIGADGSHNHPINSSSNVPPFFAVHIWRRES